MSTSESFICFGCPRCTSTLKAPIRHAGQRKRCPVCQWAITVPRESRRSDFAEYTFHDDSAPTVDAGPETAFECPVCHTRMTAPSDQAGQQVACPDCRTLVPVPTKVAPRPESNLRSWMPTPCARTMIRRRSRSRKRSTLPCIAGGAAR